MSDEIFMVYEHENIVVDDINQQMAQSNNVASSSRSYDREIKNTYSYIYVPPDPTPCLFFFPTLEPEILTLIDSHPSQYNPTRRTRNSYQEPSRTEPGFTASFFISSFPPNQNFIPNPSSIRTLLKFSSGIPPRFPPKSLKNPKISLEILEFKSFFCGEAHRFEVVVPVSLRNKVETFLFVGAKLGFQLAAELWIVNKVQVNFSLLIFKFLHEDKSCHSRDGGVSRSPKRSITGVEEHADFEPHDGIEFESHEAAYAFYQEYAKSMGFTTSIKNSRRSKKSKEFIDAKFACSRYGTTPESDTGSSRRPSVKKTDCKASMHVKRKRDGKWYIHEFIKDHNHELLPALAYHFRIHRNVKLAEKNNIDILNAVSERTRKMYVEMSRQCGGSQEVGLLTNDLNYQFDKGRCLSLEEGDAQVMLEYFMHIQKENPYFFYAIDLNEDQRLRNLFWIDAKSRKDYVSFSDVVFFDTSYMKSNEKMPFALLIGVNHHCQPMLLGCALIADETKPTFVWLMKTWLRAVGGQAPKVIITDQDKSLKSALEEVFPCSSHCFALWHVLERIPEILAHVVKQHENFMQKFSKCIFKSVTDEQFDLRWWKMVSRFELQENEWIHTLYEDRKKWIPAYMRGSFMAGMSTAQRSESISSFFDKYIHKKISLKEFMRQYGMILQNRYEEEAIADFDTLHKQPALKSPSPWEKQMSTIYTHTIFKKFQVEVLGVVGCHPKKEAENGENVTFRVDDCEKDENFMVTWNEARSDVSCSCLLFEYNGFLCRHAMIVLQMCGLSTIPSQYILKRWTKDAKNIQLMFEGTERIQTRVQRYNDLCRRAIELGEEGSLSEESYGIAFRALDEALKNCVNVNNRSSALTECSSSAVRLRDLEEDTQGIHATKTSRKKNTNKKRKVHSEPEAAIVEAQDSLQQMDNLTVGGMTLNGYYGTHQNVQGLIQLNLMEPPHDGYYVNQQNMQGLGQLNTIAPGHDGFFGSQQSIPGLGHLDFRQPSFTYGLQDEPSLRAAQLHGNNAR